MIAAARSEVAVSPEHKIALRELARHEEQLAEWADRRNEALGAMTRHRTAITRLRRLCQKLSSRS